jgi:hypothetical protein
MRAVVFLGPSLPAAEARRVLRADYRPPVSQGDVLRAVAERPRVIGIVDGYFERVPSVWHKEILWAMSQGIHVVGAASMGALRAAELGAFGMVGVGEIFAGFAGGELEADDEVAIAHGAAEDGFRSLSEALVNIRATLRAAAGEGVIGEAVHGELLRLARAAFYADRCYPQILAEGARAGLPERDLAALRAWLPGGRVDQKRLDALALLGVVKELAGPRVAPKEVRYTFEHTDAWEAALRRGPADQRSRSGLPISAAARSRRRG